MTTPRIVGGYKGVGRITSPDEDIAVRYDLTEFQEILESGIPGVRSIGGVVIARANDVFPAVGQKYVLHMEDGRKLNVWIESGAGKVRATGGIF